MPNKSAIDTIYELEKMMEEMRKQMSLMDSNIKIMSNKMSKLQQTVNALTSLPQQSEAPPSVIVKSGNTSKENIFGPVKMFGKFLTPNKMPIEGVSIIIYNADGDAVKTRLSDKEGYWETRLPAGKYGIECKRDKMMTITRTVLLAEGAREFEVT